MFNLQYELIILSRVSSNIGYQHLKLQLSSDICGHLSYTMPAFAFPATTPDLNIDLCNGERAWEQQTELNIRYVFSSFPSLLA